MGDLDDLIRLPDDFDGQVRLFPLPSMVLFPHAMQPLHIFEPRYCEMLTEALESDHLIAMATLSGGAPSGYAAPISKTICVGRIVSHVKLENDRHNILLVGIKRATITSEVDAGRCFRIAKIDVMDDLYPPTGKTGRMQLRTELLKAFGDVIPATESVQQGLNELMTGAMGLGPITDIIAHTLPLAVSRKLRLLGESDVDQRAKKLIAFLDSGSIHLESLEKSSANEEPRDDSNGLPFPPPFSIN